jgi:hypothetical protein
MICAGQMCFNGWFLHSHLGVASASPNPSRDDSESVWGVPGGDDGHELSDGVVAR